MAEPTSRGTNRTQPSQSAAAQQGPSSPDAELFSEPLPDPSSHVCWEGDEFFEEGFQQQWLKRHCYQAPAGTTPIQYAIENPKRERVVAHRDVSRRISGQESLRHRCENCAITFEISDATAQPDQCGNPSWRCPRCGHRTSPYIRWIGADDPEDLFSLVPEESPRRIEVKPDTPSRITAPPDQASARDRSGKPTHQLQNPLAPSEKQRGAAKH